MIDPKIVKIICDSLMVDEDEVTPEANFMEDLGADSLDVVQLTMEFEEAFDIMITDEMAEKAHTVQQAADMIEKLKVKQ